MAAPNPTGVRQSHQLGLQPSAPASCPMGLAPAETFAAAAGPEAQVGLRNPNRRRKPIQELEEATGSLPLTSPQAEVRC